MTLPSGAMKAHQSTNRKIILKRGTSHVACDLSAIILFFSDQKVVFALLQDGSKLLAATNLVCLEQHLNDRFFRINRKCIINGDFISSFKTHEKIKVQVHLERLHDKAIILLVSQKRVTHFRKWVRTL
jgi:DNA-binding LytR/AlgR family response regulator